MAKNYTIAEAVTIIAENKDLAAVQDLGRRFPLLTVSLAVITSKAGDAFVNFIGMMPDYLTAGKVEKCLKAGVEESEDAGEDAGEEETEEVVKETTTTKKTTTKAAPAKEEATEEEDLESMTGKALYELCKAAGIHKELPSTKKADMIAALRAAKSGKSEAAEEETEETQENPYEGKTAMELYKECKKRGLDAAPKKPAKFYGDLLTKDDAANAAESDADDEGWGDDEEEEAPKAPAKGKAKAETKPATGKGGKKPAAKEDDDDWDI